MPDEEKSHAAQLAEEKEASAKEGEETMRKLEEDPPDKLEDWPTDDAKYQTFGGGEGDHGYDEGPETKLGASGVRHLEDGGVEVDGEPVDNPEDFKGEPIPGGPTDPNSKHLESTAERRRKEKAERER